MRLIDADEIKQKYRDEFIKSLVDKDRGIDLSEYAEEPSKSFYRFIDEIPTVDVLDKIRAEIEALPRELPTDARNMVRRTRVLDIIDRHMKGADK